VSFSENRSLLPQKNPGAKSGLCLVFFEFLAGLATVNRGGVTVKSAARPVTYTVFLSGCKYATFQTLF